MMKIICVSAIVLVLVSSSFGNAIRQLPNQAAISFSAGLSSSMNNAALNQKIIFDNVITNIGNAYNSADGIFIAPVEGTYVFHSTMLAGINSEIRCSIIVRGNKVASMWARGSDGRHDQGANTVTVQLKPGDEVSVQNTLAGGSIYGSSSSYTTFSGYLLHSTYYQA